jgi:uncharacterized membrane protein
MNEDNGRRILWFMVAAYVLAFTLLCTLKYLSFNYNYDLAVYSNVMWNTVRGRIAGTTVHTWAGNTFKFHTHLILLLLTPFYLLFQSPLTLLFIQNMALGLGAVPLYHFSRRHLGVKESLLVSASYLLYPPLHGVNLFEFHFISLAVPLLFTAFHFMQEGNVKWFSLSCILLLSVREDVAPVVFMLCVYAAHYPRGMRTASIKLAVLSVIWFIVAVKLVMPAFGGNMDFVRQRYATLGGSIPAIAWNSLTDPVLVVRHVATLQKAEYVFKLLLPLAFLPLISPLSVIGLPALLENLLSDTPGMFDILHQYNALLIPVFYAAAVHAVRKLGRPSITWIVFGLSVVAFVWYGQLPYGRYFDSQVYSVGSHDMVGWGMVNSIPPEASVGAQGSIVSAFSNRRIVHMIPRLKGDKVEYILIDMKNQNFWPFNNRLKYLDYVEGLERDYVLLEEQDGFRLYRLRA